MDEIGVKPKIIFLNSQSPRSGHNFVAEVIRVLVDCETPVGDRSEIPLTPIINSYKYTLNTFFKSSRVEHFLDRLFLNNVRDDILIKQKNCLIKYTNFTGAEDVLYVFPDDIHVISYRDPKDCLISLFKGMKLKNNWKSRIKKLIIPVGIYHFIYSWKYAKRVLDEMPSDPEKFILIRYEDLVLRNKSELLTLINRFESKMSLVDLENEMDKINVINSSFYKEETDANTMWESSKKTPKFRPIGRKSGFNSLQMIGVKLGSKSLRKKMGYL